MKTVNILGCCILRDAFRIADTTKKYTVGKFYQFVSPISICSPKTSLDLTAEDLEIFDWKNFIKRNVCSDFNKDVMKIYADNVADYMLIDLCELRFKNVSVTLKNGEKTFLTKTKYVNELLEKSKQLPKLKDVVFEDNISFDDETVIRYIKRFMDFITSIYPENKIIMVRNLPYHKIIDEEKREISEFHNISTFQTRKRFNKFYDYVEKFYPNINVIKMPENCFCYAQHLWGIDPLHFYDEFYLYLYKAIDIICQNSSEAKERIEELRLLYSEYFKLLEKKKRAEFIAYKTELPPNLLDSPEFNDTAKWKISLSTDSNFSEKKLSTPDRVPSWAILSQPLKPKDIANKEVTLSVEFQTFDDSVLNVCIRTRDENGKYQYLLSKQFINNDSVTVSSVSGLMPSVDELNDAHFMVYLNKPSQMAKVERVKLEVGKTSTLL